MKLVVLQERDSDLGDFVFIASGQLIVWDITSEMARVEWSGLCIVSMPRKGMGQAGSWWIACVGKRTSLSPKIIQKSWSVNVKLF